MPYSADDEAARAINHLWTLTEARGLDIGTPAEQLIPRLAETLNDHDIPFVRDLLLSGFGHVEERIDLFLASGVAILLDIGTTAPNLARIPALRRTRGGNTVKRTTHGR